ncbi:MAG: TCP-1/cpn60 chaperonin family protein [Chitinophagaceae bacterium]
MDLKYKEIISSKELNEIVDTTITQMADLVTSTMGPYGRTVILTNRFEGPYTTKDGVSVIKSIGFQDPIKNEIAKLIKEVAEKTLKVAGDGTTTAVCLLAAIMKEGRRRMDRGATYLDILSELNELEATVIHMLEDMSEDLDTDFILDVASISANGDTAMGKVIEEAFQHSHNVNVEFGIESYDKIEKVNGMVLKTGYLDQALVNVPEKDLTRYTNPKVIIIGGKLDDLKTIGATIEKVPGPWLVIAEDVSPNVLSIIRDNFNRGAISIVFMKTPGFGGHRKNLLKDLELFTGAKSVAYNSTKVEYGTLDSIEIGKEKSILTRVELSKECKAHAVALQELSNSFTIGDQSRDLLEARIVNLLGAMSIIKVGGVSTVEVNEKFDRYDDSVRAVSCALEEGIVPGGGQALAIIKERGTEFTRSSFIDILLAPMLTIEKNSNYNLHIDEKDMLKEKIFDPTKVTKTAFINAISVAKALLNTNNLVLDPSLWK